jgi:hypothetical protein
LDSSDLKWKIFSIFIEIDPKIVELSFEIHGIPKEKMIKTLPAYNSNISPDNGFDRGKYSTVLI